MGWWIALGVLVIAAVAVWELRGYLAELNRTLRSEASGDRTLAPREPDPVSRRQTF